MVAIQVFPSIEQNSTRDEHFLYIFGGIRVRNNELVERELKLFPELNGTEISSFEYMSDLWRFDLLSG